MVNGEVGDVRREVVSCHRQNGMHAGGGIDGVRVVEVVPGVGELIAQAKRAIAAEGRVEPPFRARHDELP